MSKTQYLFEKISKNSRFMSKFKETQSFEEFYKLCKEIEPNITEEEIKEITKDFLVKNSQHSLGRISDEELDMISGGKMDFNKMKVFALAALLPMAASAVTSVSAASSNYSAIPSTSVSQNIKGKEYAAQLTHSLYSEVTGVGSSDTAVIKELLNKGADINAKYNGRSPLRQAIGSFPDGPGGDDPTGVMTEIALETIKFLIDNGANVNEKEDSDSYCMGMTPLMSANTDGKLPLAKLLIENGADIEAKDANGMTALIHAVDCNRYSSDSKLVRLLLEKGADVNATDKNGKKAIDYTYNDDLKNILRNPVEHKLTQTKDDQKKDTQVSKEKTKEQQEALDKELANIVKKSYNFYRSMVVIKRLLDKGANPDSALKFAVTKINGLEVVKLLIERGADVNGKSVVSSAITTWSPDSARDRRVVIGGGSDSPEILKCLLDNGVDVNKKYDDDWTALMYASYSSRNIEKLKLLIERGADVNAKSKVDTTALSIAVYNGNDAAVKLLEKNGATYQ